MPSFLKPHLPPSRALAALAIPVLVAACSSSHDEERESVALAFATVVSSEAFDLTKTFANIGVEKATIAPQDFRLYVHDVTLVAPDGTTAKVELGNDGVWQRDGVALLDFESGIGLCSAGTRETNTRVVGTVLHRHDWTGLTLKVGLPESMNHLDVARALAPFNEPGLWWSWKSGYKYARVDIETPEQPKGFYFHLGATWCMGDATTAYRCVEGSVAPIALSGLDPHHSTVTLDLAELFAQSQVNRRPDMQADFVAGCMSSASDPDCSSTMGALGLAVGSAPAPALTNAPRLRIPSDRPENTPAHRSEEGGRSCTSRTARTTTDDAVRPRVLGFPTNRSSRSRGVCAGCTLR